MIVCVSSSSIRPFIPDTSSIIFSNHVPTPPRDSEPPQCSRAAKVTLSTPAQCFRGHCTCAVFSNAKWLRGYLRSVFEECKTKVPCLLRAPAKILNKTKHTLYIYIYMARLQHCRCVVSVQR